MRCSFLSRFLILPLAMVATSSALLMTGCGAGTAAPEGNALVPNATIKGVAMGGQQPILGATLNLYSVGTTGYGSTGKLLATTTTSSGGNFQFTQSGSLTGPTSTVSSTYGCPTASTLVYLTVAGGDPTNTSTSTNNPAIKLIDALGPCSSIGSSQLVVSEVSTVVSVAALQQYISPINETIGSPSTTSISSNQSAATTGIANAFTLVSSLLNQAVGAVNATYSPASSVGTVVATPEVSKINTIADVIASCVNTTTSSSSTCLSLFAAAVQPSIPSATNFASSYTPAITASDTLQAALFMLQNPTNAGTQVTTCNGASATTNIGCLFSLSTATPPFTGLTAAPADWTVAVTYASPSTQTVGGVTVGYLNEPEYLAIDKYGNVWINNYVVPTATGYGNGLTEMNNQGGLVQQVLTGQNQLVQAVIPVIDPAGDVWLPNQGSTTAANVVGLGKTVVEFPVNGSASSANLFNVAGGPFSLASNGLGDIYIAELTKSITNTGGGNGTAGSDVELIPHGSAAGTTATVISATGSAYSTTGVDAFASAAIDANNDFFVTTDSTTLFAFTPPTSGTAYGLLTTTSGLVDGVGIAVDSSNNAFVTNYAASAGNLSEFSVSGGALTPASGSPFAVGFSKSVYSTIDGAGNTWATAHTASTGPVMEVAHTGVAISPTTGFPHTWYYPTGVAVDPSGNVWVGTENKYSATATAASGSNGGAAAGGSITEIIGAAVPVITPIAAGLPTTVGGTSKLATTPQ